jgi:hypothetical protein
MALGAPSSRGLPRADESMRLQRVACPPQRGGIHQPEARLRQ